MLWFQRLPSNSLPNPQRPAVCLLAPLTLLLPRLHTILRQKTPVDTFTSLFFALFFFNKNNLAKLYSLLGSVTPLHHWHHPWYLQDEVWDLLLPLRPWSTCSPLNPKGLHGHLAFQPYKQTTCWFPKSQTLSNLLDSAHAQKFLPLAHLVNTYTPSKYLPISDYLLCHRQNSATAGVSSCLI